jgi:hypothetical protein
MSISYKPSRYSSRGTLEDMIRVLTEIVEGTGLDFYDDVLQAVKELYERNWGPESLYGKTQDK